MGMENREGFIWVNGELVKWNEAKIHTLTHGLHYASSVFEGERAYNGKIFKSLQHSERLKKSAETLGFEIPYSVNELEKAKYEVIKANNLTDCYMRPFAFLGSDQLGLQGTGIGVNTVIAAWEWGAYFGGDKMKGLNFSIAEFKRPDPATAPSHAKAAGLYMICTIEKNRATANGFDDALMLDYRGYISEATAANIFFVMDDGKIHTPTPDCFLNGITRQTAIEIAKSFDIEVVERHMKPEEMANASECFVTGTAAEIMPVASIGDYNFNPGNICQKFIAEYDRLVGK